MKLIDKDALVAEIMSRIDDIEVSQKAGLIKKRDAETKIILFKSILSLIDTLEVKEVPIWEKVSPDTGQTTLYKNEDKSYLERFGYRIDLNELDKLPKKNLKAQKGKEV